MSGSYSCVPRNETARPHYFSKHNYNVLSPNFHIDVSVSDYIFPGPVCLVGSSKIGRWSRDPVPLRLAVGNKIPPLSPLTTWSCSKTLHDLKDQQSPSSFQWWGKTWVHGLCCDSPEQRGQRLEPNWHFRQLSWKRGSGEHVLYRDGSLKGVAVPTALAEMLSCKLLSTVAAVIMHLKVLYMCWKSTMASHAITLCYGGQPNEIVMSRMRNEDFRTFFLILRSIFNQKYIKIIICILGEGYTHFRVWGQ